MGLPGLPSSQAPKDPSDFYAKRFTDLERQMRELAPSIARSVSGIVAGLQSTVAALAAAVADIATLVSKQVEDGSIGYSITSFAVPTSLSSVATQTLNIPSGFTKASILGVVSVGAWNGSATGDYLYARAMINGVGGAAMPTFAGAGSYAQVTVSAIRTLTGLVGPTISVDIECNAASGWGSNGANSANSDVIAIFRR